MVSYHLDQKLGQNFHFSKGLVYNTYEYVSKDTEFVWPSVLPSADCVEPQKMTMRSFTATPAVSVRPA